MSPNHLADPLAGRRLRILQVAAFPFPSPQGSQVYVRGMARALARRGHDVTVVCYNHGLGEPDPEYTVVRTPPVPGYQNFRSGPDFIKPLLDAALAAKLARLDADVVHAHNFEAPLAAAVAQRLRRWPVVYNAHTALGEELPAYFRGALAQRIARRAGGLLDRTVPRLADHAIAISPRNAAFLRQIGCRKVSMIPPGIDAEDIAPAIPQRLPPGFWVVYAGNPDRYQDLDVLFSAMRRVPEAGLLIISASPLEAFDVRGLPRVKGVRTADFGAVRRWMAAADVAALPRSVCSGYPIKLLNYLGMGLPTVSAAGAAPPMPGMVVVADRDPAAMASAIRALMAEPARRQRLGQRALQHVRQRWLWTHRVREVEQVYAELLGSRGRRGILHDAETDFR